MEIGPEAAPKTSKNATVRSPSAWTDALQFWCVAPHLFETAISGASATMGSAEPRSCRSALRVCGDHTWTFPDGFISTQGICGHHCRSVLCNGFPWKHRSIYRAPRGIWVGDGYGSTRPTFLSACSGRLGALEYRCVDRPSTVLGQTRMMVQRTNTADHTFSYSSCAKRRFAERSQTARRCR